jgi:hypothetical protein
MDVSPRALDRLVQENSLSACGVKQSVIRLNQEACGERLFQPITKTEVAFALCADYGGSQSPLHAIQYEEPRGLNSSSRLGQTALNSCEFGHAIVASRNSAAGCANGRHSEKIS